MERVGRCQSRSMPVFLCQKVAADRASCLSPPQQALLEIAPSYLDYMNGTATKPTALAKILGFYSVKSKSLLAVLSSRTAPHNLIRPYVYFPARAAVHNLETGTSTKRDLLVMENIFFDQDVSKTFDLKGIEGRRVKTSQGPGDTVGHDREWVEGQQKTLLVVHPHSKRILREAIAADAKFLSANSIVDFSLLVGVDEDKKELAVGLVDAIGAFTFFKALESKGKQLASKGLVNDKGAAGRVTVVSPNLPKLPDYISSDSISLTFPFSSRPTSTALALKQPLTRTLSPVRISFPRRWCRPNLAPRPRRASGRTLPSRPSSRYRSARLDTSSDPSPRSPVSHCIRPSFLYFRWTLSLHARLSPIL